MSDQRWTVGEVARLAKVTVRTLHHYDEIGLLSPVGRSEAGYRLYDADDLTRLHRILLFRELDFSLEAVARLMDDPAFDPAEALRAQRELLLDRARRVASIVEAVDRTLLALEEGRTMSAAEMFEGFEALDRVALQQEAEARWGETEAYRESMRRTKGFTKGDRARIKAESEAIEQALADLMAEGRVPDSEKAMEQAEAHRAHIGNFYECSHTMHVALADMYEADPRFRQHYDRRAEGLASYVAAAIRANAARQV
jgi:MerR family transcriptional regulator, thiopeptide resistance regulator